MTETRDDGPIVLFDGVCNLCHAAVRFILARDREARFRFASLESETGRDLTTEGIREGTSADSMILVEGGLTYARSEAAIRIAARLSLPWRALGVLRVVPRPVRDGAYDLVARNRYRWFGRKDFCPVPDEDIRDRFLS
jgi:predicted DCC family thiol-disulfide oxidoreductase YuxK